MCTMHLSRYDAKQLNLKLKTRPKQLLGSISLPFPLPGMASASFCLRPVAKDQVITWVVLKYIVNLFNSS